MQLIHALVEAGQDGTNAYAECSCGERVWGYDDRQAWEAFELHRFVAKLVLTTRRSSDAQ
jgi:hypothetical protein